MTHQFSTYDQPPTPTQPRPRILWIAVAGAILLAVLGAGAYFVWGRSSGPTLTAAEAECNKGRSGGDIADGGKTLVVHMKGSSPTQQVQGGMDAETLACILRELETPTAVVTHIDGTRALDGQQTDSWDGFSARWTYHPDQGLNMTIEQK